ncbi:hypothetical protein Hanom_Chr17g01549981 [Helianthus anomalus]
MLLEFLLSVIRSCCLFPSLEEDMWRSLRPKLLSLSSLFEPICPTSFLDTGCRILDFFRASAAALETSSAFNRAKVHGLIFTAAEFFFLMGSSSVFFPSELTELVSGGTTSYCKQNTYIINKQNFIQ